MPDAISLIRSLISSAGFSGHRAAVESLAKPKYPFVTISRQAGAGGHSLCAALQHLLESSPHDPFLMGWRLLDAKAVHDLLQRDSHLEVPLRTLDDEEYHSGIEDLVYNLIAHRVPQDMVIHKTFMLIRSLARQGKVIILGRGAACLTADLPTGIHVRLVAPWTDRVQRMSQLGHLSDDAAARSVAEQDTFRLRLVRDCFGKDVNDPLLYHCLWNTHMVPIDEIARRILQMIRERQPVAPVA